MDKIKSRSVCDMENDGFRCDSAWATGREFVPERLHSCSGRDVPRASGTRPPFSGLGFVSGRTATAAARSAPHKAPRGPRPEVRGRAARAPRARGLARLLAARGFRPEPARGRSCRRWSPGRGLRSFSGAGLPPVK